MPLIKPSAKTYRTVKGKVPQNLLDELNQYIDWAKVNIDDFLEQAISLVFKQDIEWKKRNKEK